MKTGVGASLGFKGHPDWASAPRIRYWWANRKHNDTWWQLRLYHPYGTYPRIAVWLVSRPEHHSKGYFWSALKPIPKTDVPQHIQEQLHADLVTGRIEGRIRSTDD